MRSARRKDAVAAQSLLMQALRGHSESGVTGNVVGTSYDAQSIPAGSVGDVAVVKEPLPLPDLTAPSAVDATRHTDVRNGARTEVLKKMLDLRRHGLVAAVILGALLLVVTALNRMEPTLLAGADGESRSIDCLEKIALNTSIVLDISGAGEAAKNAIVARIKGQINAKANGAHRISVFTTAARAGDSATPVISLCRLPGAELPLKRGQAATQTYSDMKLIDAVQTLLNASDKPEHEKAAPIARTLADISLSQYLRSPANTLLVFSDMLEDTAEFSILTCRSPREVVDAFRDSRRGGLERPAFGNTYIAINLIPRVGVAKEVVQCKQYFWNWFFGDVGGPHAKLEFDYLPGGHDVPLLQKGKVK